MNKLMNDPSARSSFRNVISVTLAGLLLIVQGVALAKSSGGKAHLVSDRYIVVLRDPPAALYDGGDLSVYEQDGPLRMAATAPQVTGETKLNMRAPNVRAYIDYLAGSQDEFLAEASAILGREIDVVHYYRNATNGLAIEVSAAEAELLSKMPLIHSITQDEISKIQTYAGPPWIGAREIWSGDATGVAAKGEGMVIGVIDTGINFTHVSFSHISKDGYVHTNPKGTYLGLCDDPEVHCNDKLIGVYDYIEENPATETEEYTKGLDDAGHGSHVASIAAGNPSSVNALGGVVEVSGVAPRANIISYRVCYEGDPATETEGECVNSATIKAVDQAIEDGVDVLNYSVGGEPRDPWRIGSVDWAFLGARAAGIYAATSAGNEGRGPTPSSISSPARAPWITAVGSATHNVIIGNSVENFSGGSEPLTDVMVGASQTEGSGNRVIVHARDYGNALCGTGPAESGRTCLTNTGKSNPWAGEKPFNGEIVVCDRGIYGRVEKGRNLELAGAGGYILANTPEFGEWIVSDEHCLPASHVGLENGDKLRSWLDSGTGHGAEITASQQVESDSAADMLSDFSSRGPGTYPVEEILKPNVIAPGDLILAAWKNDSNFVWLPGTSMASPHVAGAAALIKSAKPDWSASKLSSAIEMTATQELAKDHTGGPVTAHEIGSGRPQLGQAINAGLYLDISEREFIDASPSAGGDPKELNLPGLVDASCESQCTFTRTVTDMMGGGDWMANAEGFPRGAVVTIVPSEFSLSSGQARTLQITIDVQGVGGLPEWVEGRIRLSANGSPDLYLSASVKPRRQFDIETDKDSGWQEIELKNLPAMPNATFTAAGLDKQYRRAERHPVDPTDSNPFDGGEGVFTHWHEMPDGAFWLYAETLPSTAIDIDLYVGRDSNGNGLPEEFEVLCESSTPEDVERCDLYDLEAGDYWVLVQNWDAGLSGIDEMVLLTAAVGPGTLAASGPGIVGENDTFPLRLSWDNLKAVSGETWVGAVSIGTTQDAGNDLGIIPVYLQRTGYAEPQTFPLASGKTHSLSLDAGASHDRMFIDVPPGTDNLTVSATGGSAEESNGLRLDLYRMSFDSALSDAPFALPAPGGTPLASATGIGGQGPLAIVEGGVEPGRWYVVLSNNGGIPAAIDIQAEADPGQGAVTPRPGLWEPASRPQIGQGFDFNVGGGDSRVGTLIWYTYDEAGQPAWYIAAALMPDGNIWTSDLLRVTNDGTTQQLAPVGTVTVTYLAEEDILFSTTLFGESGTDRMKTISPPTCPQVDGAPASYTGIWYRGEDGLGGASVVVDAANQGQIHYLFDNKGDPRWLLASDVLGSDPKPTDPEIQLLQFSGYCSVCEGTPDDVDLDIVGTVNRSFDSNSTGSWTLDYEFEAPLGGTVTRTEAIEKLTNEIQCQ